MLSFLTTFNKTLIPKSYRHHLLSLSSNISTNQQKTTTLADLLVSRGIKPPTKPVPTFTYLKDFGFSDSQIKTIISKVPALLFSDFLRKHKPKIDFLQSIGLFQQDVIKVVTSDPMILHTSLHNHIIPAFDLLKHYYGGQEIVAHNIKRWPRLIRCDILECLAPNAKTLRDFGVPESRVAKMVSGGSCCGICANTKPHKFRKVVRTVTDMGFDPSSALFGNAVCAMARQTEQGWLSKLNVCKSLGLSEGEIHELFKKQPIALWLSEKKIRAAAKFYFEKFNWTPSHLLKNPNALTYSLDKRVVPRCSVLQALVSRNNFKKVNIVSILIMTENKFLERYVNKYKDEIPEVLDAYQGKINFDDFNFDLE